MRKQLLVLLVEDNLERGQELSSCIPPRFHCVWVKSVGAARGVLARDQFNAALLDWDLGGGGNGEDVAASICETQNRDCEILIHSTSSAGGRAMCSTLHRAGFSVSHSPWNGTDGPSTVRAWFDDLSENLEIDE